MCLMNEHHLPAADDGLKLFEFQTTRIRATLFYKMVNSWTTIFVWEIQVHPWQWVCVAPKLMLAMLALANGDGIRHGETLLFHCKMRCRSYSDCRTFCYSCVPEGTRTPCKAPCGLLHASCGIMWRAKVCHVACVLSWHGKVCTIGRATTVRKLRKWLSTAQGAGYGNTPANRARQGWQSSVDRNCKCWWFTMGVCQILLFSIWVGSTPIHKSQLFWCELQGYVRFWPNATLSDWRNRWMSLSPGYWSSKIWSPHHKRLLQGVAEHFETQFW